MTGAELPLLTKQVADVIGEALKQRDEKIAALEARLAVLEAAAAPRREARSEDLP